MPHNVHFRPEQVHPTVFLAVGAVVVGDVTIGEDASVWFNAVVRGDTEAVRIGSRSNIQDGCVLHADLGFPCLVGNGVTIGHGAIIHGAVIEDDVLIGMGAIILNGVKIGAGSIVGAGALVTEGKEIPAGSLVVGLPGKILRRVTPEEITRIQESALHYVAAAAEYRDSVVRDDSGR